MTFDHHQVMVADVWSILITYPWMSLETRNEPWVATLIFNPAPKHLHTAAQVRRAIHKHPIAPPIQTIIEQLIFYPARTSSTAPLAMTTHAGGPSRKSRKNA